MREIKELVGDIKHELKGAEKYAREAVKHKTEYPALAAVYYRMACEKLDHVDMLHKEAVTMIDRAERAGKDVPRGMRDIWAWYHDMMIEDASDIRHTLDMYKG